MDTYSYLGGLIFFWMMTLTVCFILLGLILMWVRTLTQVYFTRKTNNKNGDQTQ